MPATTHFELGKVQRLPLKYDSQDPKSALNLILTLAPEWASQDSHVEFIRFTDGITNTLLKAINVRPGLSKEEIDRDAILLRAYGNKTSIIIDREREAANHELLMKHNLAPELLARFENGMLYRYVPGSVAQAQDLPDPRILAAVARRLAEWHATVPCLPDSLHANNSGAGGDAARIANVAPGKPAPNVWTTMQKWILALPTNTEKKLKRQALLQRELDDLVEKLSQRPGLGHNGLVFAHCDLLCANIIIHKEANEPTSVSFIDYEYGTPSPAAFDVANHFAEWAGYECDYTAIPNVFQRRAFIREYIKTYAELSGTNTTEAGSTFDLEEESRKLEVEVDLFRGVPGFYWGIWSSIQAEISTIDFDYAGYAELRLGEYWAFKAERDGSREAAGEEMPLREKTWWQGN